MLMNQPIAMLPAFSLDHSTHENAHHYVLEHVFVYFLDCIKKKKLPRSTRFDVSCCMTKSHFRILDALIEENFNQKLQLKWRLGKKVLMHLWGFLESWVMIVDSTANN